MMTPEETWLEQALEHEQRTMQRPDAAQETVEVAAVASGS